MSKRALILGITGQDGSYLAELLLEKGYEVHGLYRRSSSDNLWRIRHLLDRVMLYRGDMADPLSVERVLVACQPQEVYNEADQDNVDWSYSTPGYSLDITAGAVARTLESIRQLNPSIRFFQPCSAMMFGDTKESPQDEGTRFFPQSPYACAKACAYYLCRHYRREYEMFVSTAIFYNHDSPRRRGDYLLHRIAKQAIQVSRGEREAIELWGEDGVVDIGYASEYMDAAYQIMQLHKPNDFVIGSGRTWRISDIAREALRLVGVQDLRREGDRIRFLSGGPRPGPQTTVLTGDIRKAQEAFGWNPQSEVSDVLRLIVSHYLREGVP